MTKIIENRCSEIRALSEGPYDTPHLHECALLWRLAAAVMPGRCIVEIGSWRGRSACVMADACIEGVQVIAVDHFKGDDTGGEHPSKEIMSATIAKLGLERKILVVDADAKLVEWINVLPCRPGLVFYDADHKTQPTIEILSQLLPLAKGALLVIHDSNWEMTQKAIHWLSAFGLSEVFSMREETGIAVYSIGL
jgi:predicted O-methyltransferase YrrM